MSRYLDWACYALLLVVGLIAASTFGVAYLDYLERRNEYDTHAGEEEAYHSENCQDTKRIAGLRDEIRTATLAACEVSLHAAQGNAGQKALRDVLSRWSVCDAKGCDVFIDRFGRYFSLAALLLALAVGAACVVLVQRTTRARAIETLPQSMR